MSEHESAGAPLVRESPNVTGVPQKPCAGNIHQFDWLAVRCQCGEVTRVTGTPRVRESEPAPEFDRDALLAIAGECGMTETPLTIIQHAAVIRDAVAAHAATVASACQMIDTIAERSATIMKLEKELAGLWRERDSWRSVVPVPSDSNSPDIEKLLGEYLDRFARWSACSTLHEANPGECLTLFSEAKRAKAKILDAFRLREAVPCEPPQTPLAWVVIDGNGERVELWKSERSARTHAGQLNDANLSPAPFTAEPLFRGVRSSASVSTTTPDALAQRFHETYERLAPSFGYETRRDSAKPWADVPERNRNLMIAVCRELLRSSSVSETTPAPDIDIALRVINALKRQAVEAQDFAAASDFRGAEFRMHRLADSVSETAAPTRSWEPCSSTHNGYECRFASPHPERDHMASSTNAVTWPNEARSTGETTARPDSDCECGHPNVEDCPCLCHYKSPIPGAASVLSEEAAPPTARLTDFPLANELMGVAAWVSQREWACGPQLDSIRKAIQLLRGERPPSNYDVGNLVRHDAVCHAIYTCGQRDARLIDVANQRGDSVGWEALRSLVVDINGVADRLRASPTTPEPPTELDGMTRLCVAAAACVDASRAITKRLGRDPMTPASYQPMRLLEEAVDAWRVRPSSAPTSDTAPSTLVLTNDEGEAVNAFWSYGATRGNHSWSKEGGEGTGPSPGPLTKHIPFMSEATRKIMARRSVVSTEGETNHG